MGEQKKTERHLETKMGCTGINGEHGMKMEDREREGKYECVTVETVRIGDKRGLKDRPS